MDTDRYDRNGFGLLVAVDRTGFSSSAARMVARSSGTGHLGQT